MQITMNQDLVLRMITPEDAEKVFALTDASREYLKEWLPWLDFTKELADTKAFKASAMLSSTCSLDGCI